MAALVCEICGGKLMAKAGGLFECEYCGMQYDKTRIQEMVQEIKGTVRVEGTVQVQGTVSVDNSANKENLLKRIAICAEDGHFDKVEEMTEELLNLDPECGEAYLWQVAAKFQSATVDDLFKRYPEDLKKARESAEWKNALRYLDKERSASMEQRMNETVNYWKKSDPALKERFEQIKPAQDLLFSVGKALLGLQADGTVRVTYAPEAEWVAPVAQWTCVKKIFVDDIYEYVLGLCWDGKVLGVSKGESADAMVKEVRSWANNEEKIVDMVADRLFVAALFDDGEVCATEDQYGEDGIFYFGYACDWEDVESLSVVRRTASNVYGEFFGKHIGYTLETVMVMGVTRDGHTRCSASCYDLDNVKRLDVELGVPWWEKQQNVAKINGKKGKVLYRDGTVSGTDREEKYLDFDISDKGRLMDIFLDREFRERNLLSVTGDFALRADGTVLRAIPRDSKHRSSYENARTEEWTNIVALHHAYLGGACCVLGLREDGCVQVAWGGEPAPGISVEGWKLFDSVDTFHKERTAAQNRIKDKSRAKQQKAWDEKGQTAREYALLLRDKFIGSPKLERPIHMGISVRGRIFATCKDKFERDIATQWNGVLSLSMGECHVLGLKENGTVLACGDNTYSQCDVADWKYVKKVVASGWHSLGLRDDGTVLACGNGNYGQCDVTCWRDLVDVAAGRQHTVGLKKDGTVVACGLREQGQCEVSGWKNIVKIYACNQYTVGIREDGTALCTEKKFDVSGWKNIVDVATGAVHILGLTADGCVVATGEDNDGCCKRVKPWENIVAVSATNLHSIGLRADGTVVAVGDNDSGQCNVSQWTDVVAVSTGPFSTLGVCSDGTVVYAGNEDGNMEPYRISGAWKLFDNAMQMSLYRDKENQLAENIRKMRMADEVVARRRNAGLCQHCGGELKGFLLKKCVSCGKSKDY